jgi:uncharacterized protein with PIN domain
MRFLTDRNLGKLTKWMRILGYDTVVYQGAIDRNFLQYGLREGRVVLTRRRDMAARNFLGTKYVVMSDHVPSQLHELRDNLSLEIDPDKFLTICLGCNEAILDIPKDDIKGSVPPYVFRTHDQFRFCPRCRKIFWAGTHKDNIVRFLTRHNLYHHL